jgi:ubiquinol-cytochrome c reductase cytochrome b subunit
MRNSARTLPTTGEESPAGRAAHTNGTTAAVPPRPTRASAAGGWLDERVGLARALNTRLFTLRKVFPEHWSFMFGEIALWSLVVLLLTGTFLTFWFDPSMAEVQYQGSYDALRGTHMSAAYASTLDLSFDVRGGLLMRQMHHWSAHLFIAAMMIHLLRHALTGSFRKPREVNWVLGCTMLLLGTLQGFFGYSLPDDLLSGTGLRIADGIVRATPVAGTYLSFFLFGGEFPGEAAIPRLYIVHVLLLPALLLALVAVHLLLVFYHKHTQWPGPGRSERNVVGYPFFPVYAAKTSGFFFIVFGVTALMGGLLSINPVWKYGPYDPAKVTAGAQPDWYLGFVEGALRVMPGWETHVLGVTISWNVVLPALVLPLALLAVVLLWPFLEARVTGDTREHHLLQRPRDAPFRTAFFMALVSFYGLLWAAGGNDVLATRFALSVNQITYATRAGVLVLPVLVFMFTRRLCVSLQRQDRERLLSGRETGAVRRTPEGGYHEERRPLAEPHAYTLLAAERDHPILTDGDGAEEHDTRRPGLASRRMRNRLSRAMFADNLPHPTPQELERAGRARAVERSTAATASSAQEPEDPVA